MMLDRFIEEQDKVNGNVGTKNFVIEYANGVSRRAR